MHLGGIWEASTLGFPPWPQRCWRNWIPWHPFDTRGLLLGTPWTFLGTFFDAPGAPWHPMDSPWHQLLASRGSPLAPHGHPLAATLALLCKRLKNDQKNHYFELHFWCVFGKGVHAIRPRRRSPNPHFAHCSALDFKTSNKAKDQNALWTRGGGHL